MLTAAKLQNVRTPVVGRLHSDCHLLLRQGAKSAKARSLRSASHRMNEAASENYHPKTGTTKAIGNLQCVADAKRASAHFAAFDNIDSIALRNTSASPLLLCAIIFLYDNEILNQKLE